MTIAIVGSRAFDSLEYHLADALRVAGHDVRLLDMTDVAPVSYKLTYWATRFAEPADRWLARRVACRIRAWQPRLVLVVYRHMHPLLVESIKRDLPGTLVAQVNPDALTNLEKQQVIAAEFDQYFSKEPYMVSFLRDKAGLNAHYLPEGFNPRVHQRPVLDKAEAERLANIDVLVYGGLYPYRTRLIERLIRAGLRVTVYGAEGPYLRPAVRSAFRGQYLVGEEKNRLIYGAKVVFNGMHYAEVTAVNQKYFEINGIGGFQLCDYKPTVDEYTGVPAERMTFDTITDAIDKIRHYIAHPDERHDLAERQYQHFQQYHTLDQRVAALLHTVGLT